MTPIEYIHEDTGQGYDKPPEPQDPEPDYEERLEAEDATIIATRFPASGTTITKRSLTPKEWDEQRQL